MSLRYPLLLLPISLLVPACTSSGAPSRDGGVPPDSARPGDGSSGRDGAADAATDSSHDAHALDDFAWVRAFPATSGSSILAMASDANSVVIVGQITGSAAFGTTTLLGPATAGNAFVAKLDTSGNVLWAQVASGAESDFEAVVIDGDGNIIVSGTDFGDAPTVTFGGTTLTPNPSDLIGGNAVGSSAGMLIAMSPAGAVTWSQLVESTGEVNVGSLALSGSTIYAAGPIIDDAAFGPAGGTPITGCGTEGCVYLAAWASDGTLQWAKPAASTPHRGTGADPREVWLAANATGLALAIGGDQAEAGGATDAAQLVVNEYDLTGALTWTRSAPLAGGAPGVTGVALDPSGNVYASGEFGNGLVLGSFKVTGSDYVVKYSATGSVLWALTDPKGGFFGIHGLALGSSLYTFGNGDVGRATGVGTSMSLDGFDPATGKVVSVDPCGAAMNIGQTVSASSGGVFAAGVGGPPGRFGKYTLPDSGWDSGSDTGLFVAKKK